MNDREYREAVARHYDTLLADGDDPVLDPPELQEYMNRWDGSRFLELLALKKTDSVLEIGVGTGRLAVKTVPMCGRFTVIDLAPETLRRARKHLKDYDHAVFICDDFMTYPFSRQYDVVYSSLTWMHLQDKMRAAAKAASLLKPGGRFVLCVEREQRCVIDAGTTRIGVYPDDRAHTGDCIRASGLQLALVAETAFGLIYVAGKA